MKLIILRGVPSAGKSTLARQVMAQNTDRTVAYVSADDFFVGDDGVYRFNPKRLGPAHEHARWRVEVAMRDEVDLILVDNTNTTGGEMRPYVNLAASYGYEVEYREPDTPWWSTARTAINESRRLDRGQAETLLRPHARILAEKNLHDVSEDKILQMLLRFQDVDSPERNSPER